jgi:calcineurin-like phosphoesterase family protein
MIITADTWLISDTHFGHGNIVQYANRPARHNEIMLENWWATVQPDDTVLHLGDICMTSSKQQVLFDLYRQVRDLPGHKFMMRGNHDQNTAKWYLDKLGVTVLREYVKPSRSKNNMQGGVMYYSYDSGLEAPTLVGLSHVPDATEGCWDLNIHGHVHVNGYPRSLYESGRDYRNICVEVTGYKPQRLCDVLTNPACYQTPAQAGIGIDKRLEAL